MGYYSKNIAVIRGLKSGFSADGGPLSGLVKAEKYGSRLKIELSLINFAPLTEGRYVAALSDGKHTCILEGTEFEGASEVDTSAGFAALVCYVNGTVSPVASAVCGNFHSAAIGIREEIEKQELINSAKPPEKYEDEALAEENYYEYEQAFKDGGAVREDPQKEENGRVARENETPSRAVQSDKGAVERGQCAAGRGQCAEDKGQCAISALNGTGAEDKGQCAEESDKGAREINSAAENKAEKADCAENKAAENDEAESDEAAPPSSEGGAALPKSAAISESAAWVKNAAKPESGAEFSGNGAVFDCGDGTGKRDCAEQIPLAHGTCFYERMKGEIEGVLAEYPVEQKLEEVVDNSRWVRITYGDGKFYVFGVIYGGGKPQYICYGVPSRKSARPPESLTGLASFIPAARDGAREGYWVMYQDAATGASVKIDAE